MDFDDIIQQAKKQAAQDSAHMNEPFYVKTIAWLAYLGLLRHNRIRPRRYAVSLKQALQAAKLEPRISELLPAILIILPEAFTYKAKDIPRDLQSVVAAIRRKQHLEDYQGITPQAYLQWINAPIMDIAKRKIHFRRAPRDRSDKTHAIGEFIRKSRLSLALTQQQLAEKYNLSLRVIRDLEQGKMDASVKTVNSILKVFGRSLRA